MRRILALTLIAISPFVALAQDADASIGALYFEAALQELENGESARAIEFISAGLEFNEQSSDLWYARALVLSVDRFSTRSAIEASARSVDLQTWVAVSETAGRALLAGLYNRSLDHESALTVSAYEPSPQTPEIDRLALEWQRLLALQGEARWALLDRHEQQMQDRFPTEERLAWRRIERQTIPTREDRSMLEWYAANGSRSEHLLEAGLWVPDLRDAAYLLMQRDLAASDVAWAQSYLTEAEWLDARRAVVAQSAADESVDVFLEPLQSVSGDALVELTTGGSIERWLSDFSGEITFDENGDHYWDTRVRVEDGEIVSMLRDADQDGVVDVEVLVSDGALRSAVLQDQPHPMELLYGHYPFVDRVVVPVEIGTETFVLRPRAMRFDAVSLDATDPFVVGSSTSLREVRAVGIDELLTVVVRSDTRRSDGSTFERRHYESGEIANVLRDENGDGLFDHLVRTDSGMPVDGVRDIDGDGYFEIAEGYQEGRLVALAVDSNGDRRPDFFEQRGSTPVREWDLNGDGVIDTQEFRWWTDNVIQAFPEL